MRTRSTLAAVLVTGSAVVGVGPASAAAPSMICNIVEDGTLRPGITVQESTGTFTGSGPMSCMGTLDGRRSTGPGTFNETGNYQGGCLGGGGDGTVTIEVPTDGGPLRIRRPFRFEFPRLPSHGGLIGGSMSGDGFSGTFDVTPTAYGDCVVTPFTDLHAVVELDFA